MRSSLLSEEVRRLKRPEGKAPAEDRRKYLRFSVQQASAPLNSAERGEIGAEKGCGVENGAPAAVPQSFTLGAFCQVEKEVPEKRPEEA